MAHRVGPDVSPPRIIYRVEPEYSESAKAEQITGTCAGFMIREDGVPNVLPSRPVSASDLDEMPSTRRTMETEPGMKDVARESPGKRGMCISTLNEWD